MKISELIARLQGMLDAGGDVVVSASLYWQEEVEFLADAEFSALEWEWLAQDIMSNWVLESRDIGSYVEALAQAKLAGWTK